MKMLYLLDIVPGKIYLIKHPQLGLWPCRVICSLEPGWKRGHVVLCGAKSDRGQVQLLGCEEQQHSIMRFDIEKMPNDMKWTTHDIGLIEHESQILQKKIEQYRSVVKEHANKLEVLEFALKEHEESK